MTPRRRWQRADAGAVLLLLGAALLLRQLARGSLFFELVWLAALAWAAAWTFRSLAGRAPLRVRLVVYAAFGLFALLTLGRLAGAAALGFVALYFWLLFSSHGRRGPPATWLAIVAGTLATLSLVTAVDTLLPRWDNGVIFFLGMTATFTAVYLLPRAKGGARWALWPALAWAALTLLVNDPSGGVARWMVPLALIGVGAAWLGYVRRGR